MRHATVHGAQRRLVALVRSGKRRVCSESADVCTALLLVEARCRLLAKNSHRGIRVPSVGAALQVGDLGDLHSPFYISSHTSDLQLLFLHHSFMKVVQGMAANLSSSSRSANTEVPGIFPTAGRQIRAALYIYTCQND